MKVQRGDVVLVPIRFSAGTGVKTRRVLVVQSDHNNRRLDDTIVAVITSNTTRAAKEPTQFLIEVSSTEGRQSGLLNDSAVACEHLHTILCTDMHRKIGMLPTTSMKRINECLKSALGINT